MKTFDETNLRSMAANVGACLERALLAYAAGDTGNAARYDALALNMLQVSRDAARGYSPDVISRMWQVSMQAYAELSGQPAPECKPVGATDGKPRPTKRAGGPSYTPATETKPSRCRGCGMPAGGGHFQGCFDPSVQVLKLPVLRSVKPGTAAHAKGHGKILADIAKNEQETYRQRARYRNMSERQREMAKQ